MIGGYPLHALAPAHRDIQATAVEADALPMYALARPRALAALALCAAWIAITAAGALANDAAAAPGLTAPVTIAQLASCVSLAEGLIDWTELHGPRHHRFDADVSHLAQLSPGGLSEETTFDSGAGFPDCSTLVASQSAGAEVLARSQRASPVFAPVANEPLWLARPGGSAGPVGLSGLEPTIALASDGSGVLAWLEYIGERPIGRQEPGEDRRTGPAFTVQAARISPTGQLGAPQTIAGPSGGYGVQGAGSPPPGRPVALADPDGTLAVAYELLAPNSESSTVQVSEAAPEGSFTAPQTLLGEAAARASVPEDELEIAGDGGARHVLQWQVGGEHTIESALQGDPAQPFAAVPALPIHAGEAQLSGTQMDAAGETVSLLFTPSGASEAAGGALAVARRTPDGAGQTLERLVSPRAHEQVGDAHLALRSDGFAAVVWVAEVVGFGGGTTSRVMLDTAPPGGRFGPPVAVTGLAALAGASAVAFDPSGALRIAWIADEHELSGRLLAVSAQPGSADPLSMPGPRVRLRAAPDQEPRRGLYVTVRVDRPCLVRLQETASAALTRREGVLGEARTSVSHDFAAAGAARLRLPEVPASFVRGTPPAVRVLAYASSPSEASSVTQLRVRVRQGPASP